MNNKKRNSEVRRHGDGGTDSISPSGKSDRPDPIPVSPRPVRGGLTGAELNDLNSRLAPVLARAQEFEVLGSMHRASGELAAAAAADRDAGECRSAAKEITNAWFRIRELTLEVAEIGQPPSSDLADEDSCSGETIAQALDRVISEIGEDNEDAREAFDAIEALVSLTADRNLQERAKRIRECPEWTNRNGILRDHPISGGMALFRTLLVLPPVYLDIRLDLSGVVAFRKGAVKFRQAVEALQTTLRSGTEGRGGPAPGRMTLPGLTEYESERFREWLDAICAGDTKTRHGGDHDGRVATVRAIADHFRRYQDLSRSEAAERFRVEPWSRGIAALARAALNQTFTTEDVRGALKNWASD